MTVTDLSAEPQDLRTELIQAISAQLNEPDPGVVAQIRGVIQVLGPERVATLVRATVRLEQLGGVLIADGSRRRSPGGVFFVLARACLSRQQRRQVWPEPWRPETAEAPRSERDASTQSDRETGDGGRRVESHHTHTAILPSPVSRVNPSFSQRDRSVNYASSEPHT